MYLLGFKAVCLNVEMLNHFEIETSKICIVNHDHLRMIRYRYMLSQHSLEILK